MRVMHKAAVLALAVLLLAACSEDGTITKKDVGMVVGGAAGGAAGSAIWAGNPSSQVLGTILGVVVGAAVGGYIGQKWDEYDRKQVAYAMETRPDNSPAQWKNPNTGQAYQVTPQRTYYQDSTPCREFTQTIYIDGKPEVSKGTACRQGDGAWHIVSSQ
jgi:surface antigen